MKVQKFGGKHAVKTVNVAGAIWFKANDMAKILEYKNGPRAIRDNVSGINKACLRDVIGVKKPVQLNRGLNIDNIGGDMLETKPPVQLNQNDLRTIYLNKHGLLEFFQNSKKLNKDIKFRWFKDTFGIDMIFIARLSKEQETIGQIVRALAFTECVHQYPVGVYRIDLYLPYYRIAIECDEFGHNDRDGRYESARERFIRTALDCTFVRYNPDSKCFDVFEVISRVLNIILSLKTVKE